MRFDRMDMPYQAHPRAGEYDCEKTDLVQTIMQRPDFVGHREHWIGQGRNERKQQIAMGDEPVSSSSSPFLIDMYPLMVARPLSKRTDHSGVDPHQRRTLEGYTPNPRQTCDKTTERRIGKGGGLPDKLRGWPN